MTRRGLEKMTDFGWFRTNEFSSLIQFKELCGWVEDQVASGKAKEVDVKEEYWAGFEERWFYCESLAETWRLVYPDPPFKGCWLPVEGNLISQPI